MAKLGKREVVAVSDDRRMRMSVEFDVTVNKEGLFTTTLPEDEVEKIKDLGVELSTNGRRNGREGFFAGPDLSKLLDDIHRVLCQCVSRELLSEEIMIKYGIVSVCGHWLTVDGDIIPNGAWTEDGQPDEDTYWVHGTKAASSTDRLAPGVMFCAQPIVRSIYRYKNGEEKTVNEVISVSSLKETDFYNEEKYYSLRWLANIPNIRMPKEADVQYIDFTPERGEFFVNFYKAMCKFGTALAVLEDIATVDVFINDDSASAINLLLER